ncbi:MAG: ABC transporter ATP-binding protein [Candidatus Hodarchaeales archaeon]|jgi:putative ABC transport system ATP-binding protein
MGDITPQTMYDPTSELPEDLLLALFNVYKIYRSSEVETVALRGISLTIFKRETIACIGPSGSGKTTLLDIMAGLIKPTAGIVFWQPVQADISRFEDQIVTQIRNKFIGKISQTADLFPHLSVKENVMLGGLIGGKPRRDLSSFALDLLERVGLLSKKDVNPHTLSGGEKQRVAIAGSLINNPKLVLADEPTGNLDLNTGEEILDLLAEITKEYQTTFFIVTHSKQVATRAQRVIEIRDGILAGHHTDVNLESLDQSRMISTDDQGRILLPKEILKRFQHTTNFRAIVSENNLILKPVTPSESMRQVSFETNERKRINCPICETENPGKNILCTKCGGFIRKAGRF